ncbi:hypothetical protein [Scytonema sp. NUACC21]
MHFARVLLEQERPREAIAKRTEGNRPFNIVILGQRVPVAQYCNPSSS